MIEERRLIRPDYNLLDFFGEKKVNAGHGLTVGDERVLLIDPYTSPMFIMRKTPIRIICVKADYSFWISGATSLVPSS